MIEALACGVPAFGTPVGIHPVALDGIEGALLRAVGSWTPGGPRSRRISRRRTRAWTAAARAELFSADAMAARVVEAWRDLLDDRTS